MRHTKIVVTLGPATDDAGVLEALIAAGMDVARLNASHAGPAELATRLEAIRQASEQAGRPISVMLDLAGSKLRVGDVGEGTRLVEGEQFVLTSAEEFAEQDANRPCKNHQCVSYPYLLFSFWHFLIAGCGHRRWFVPSRDFHQIH